MEQLYMRLQDKVLRPKFDSSKIDSNNKNFKKIVDQYIGWFGSDYNKCNREDYENDIRECLSEFDLDGYNLAEYLKDKSFIEPDARLVEILDNSSFVKQSIIREMTIQWVKENFLEIPDNVIGKKVNVKMTFRNITNHYITGIKPETYEVTIKDTPARNEGYIVGFETVEFID
jgi:hypothetical protein